MFRKSQHILSRAINNTKKQSSYHRLRGLIPPCFSDAAKKLQQKIPSVAGSYHTPAPTPHLSPEKLLSESCSLLPSSLPLSPCCELQRMSLKMPPLNSERQSGAEMTKSELAALQSAARQRVHLSLPLPKAAGVGGSGAGRASASGRGQERQEGDRRGGTGGAEGGTGMGTGAAGSGRAGSPAVLARSRSCAPGSQKELTESTGTQRCQHGLLRCVSRGTVGLIHSCTAG